MTYLLCLIAVAIVWGAVDLATEHYRNVMREQRRINVRNKPWQVGFKARQTNEDLH